MSHKTWALNCAQNLAAMLKSRLSISSQPSCWMEVICPGRFPGTKRKTTQYAGVNHKSNVLYLQNEFSKKNVCTGDELDVQAVKSIYIYEYLLCICFEPFFVLCHYSLILYERHKSNICYLCAQLALL